MEIFEENNNVENLAKKAALRIKEENERTREERKDGYVASIKFRLNEMSNSKQKEIYQLLSKSF